MGNSESQPDNFKPIVRPDVVTRAETKRQLSANMGKVHRTVKADLSRECSEGVTDIRHRSTVKIESKMVICKSCFKIGAVNQIKLHELRCKLDPLHVSRGNASNATKAASTSRNTGGVFRYQPSREKQIASARPVCIPQRNASPHSAVLKDGRAPSGQLRSGPVQRCALFPVVNKPYTKEKTTVGNTTKDRRWNASNKAAKTASTSRNTGEPVHQPSREKQIVPIGSDCMLDKKVTPHSAILKEERVRRPSDQLRGGPVQLCTLPVTESICKQKLLSCWTQYVSEPHPKIDSKNVDQPKDGRKTEGCVVIQGVSYELKLNGKYENKFKSYSEHIDADQHNASAGEQCSKPDSEEASEREVWRGRCIEEQCSMPDSKEIGEYADECDDSMDNKCKPNKSKHTNYDKNICLIPCEFCSRLFHYDFIVEHQSGCRPDLLHYFIDCKPGSSSDPMDNCFKAAELNAQTQKLFLQAVDISDCVENSENFSKENFQREDQGDKLSDMQDSDTKLEFSEYKEKGNCAFQAMDKCTNVTKNMKYETMNLVPCKLCSRVSYSDCIVKHQSSCKPNRMKVRQQTTISDPCNNNNKPVEPDVHTVKHQGDNVYCVFDSEAKIKKTSEYGNGGSSSLDHHSFGTETSESDQHRSSAAVQCSWNELSGMQVCPVSVGVQCSENDSTQMEMCLVSVGVQCSMLETASSEFMEDRLFSVSIGVQCAEMYSPAVSSPFTERTQPALVERPAYPPTDTEEQMHLGFVCWLLFFIYTLSYFSWM